MCPVLSPDQSDQETSRQAVCYEVLGNIGQVCQNGSVLKWLSRMPCIEHAPTPHVQFETREATALETILNIQHTACPHFRLPNTARLTLKLVLIIISSPSPQVYFSTPAGPEILNSLSSYTSPTCIPLDLFLFHNPHLYDTIYQSVHADRQCYVFCSNMSCVLASTEGWGPLLSATPTCASHDITLFLSFPSGITYNHDRPSHQNTPDSMHRGRDRHTLSTLWVEIVPPELTVKVEKASTITLHGKNEVCS